MASRLHDKDNGLAKMLHNFRGLKGLRGKVGIQGDKALAVEHDESDQTNVEIAADHEFGTPTAPQRSFLRATWDERPSHWLLMLRDELATVVRNGHDPRRALMKVTQELRKAVLARMDAGISPPLSMQTLVRRNKGLKNLVKHAAAGTDDSTPLEDTGVLRGSITAVVEKTRG